MFSERQGFAGSGNRPFIIKIDTRNISTSVSPYPSFYPGYPTTNKQFRLSATGNYTVDWGDGTYTQVSNSGVKVFSTTKPIINYNTFPLHTYATAGIYTITIYGDLQMIFFTDINSGDVFDALKLTEINQWGDMQWWDLSSAFAYCVNLTAVNATDSPNLNNLALGDNVAGAFWQASISSMFYNCINAVFANYMNQWDVSKIIAMGSMFQNATLFNQPLSNWNVSNCQSFTSMFTSSGFNQNISNWNLSGLNGRSQGCEYMFQSTPFNQDLSTWNITGIASGTNVANRTPMFLNIFNSSGMSTENYSRTLIGWANQISNNGGSPIYVRIGSASGCTYNSTNYGGSPFSDAYAARAYLTNSIASGGVSWQITGDTAV